MSFLSRRAHDVQRKANIKSSRRGHSARRLRFESLEARQVLSTVYGLDDANRLLRFDTAAPGAVAPIAIQNLSAGESVVGIDIRPRTGQLYGLAVDGNGGGLNARLLVINPLTGQSTQVGGTIALTANSTDVGFGFDFNPTVDAIRLVNNQDVNMRISPNTGAVLGNDPNLNPPSQAVESAAYDRNFDGRLGATGTTLYAINATTGYLQTIGGVNQTPSPNTGTLIDVGQLGVAIDATGNVAFDIKGNGSAGGETLAIFDGDTGAGRSTGLYSINLQTGAATRLATIGDGSLAIQGMAIVPDSNMVVGADAGTQPFVRVFDAYTGIEKFSFLAYDATFTGGVRVATADVNRDSIPDIITGAGKNGTPHVKVFDGATGNQLPGGIGSFFAFATTFTGGVYVTGGDVNGDGFHDVIVGADSGGGPHVQVFSGATGQAIASFFAYAPLFSGGVRVAAADFDRDGNDEIVTAAGPTGGPHVKVFSGIGTPFVSGTTPNSFFAYAPSFTGGVYVTAGDINGDGIAEIVTGAGSGGGPHVQVFNGKDGVALASFYAFEQSFGGGVRVGVEDFDDDGLFDIAVASGFNRATEVRGFKLGVSSPVRSFFPFGNTKGAFVAGARV